ncbi:MAG: hypothetical protein IPH64_03615 [Comamonadaceae bacterium]|nr:hypothetical protein [Comamonadaceae bacterium]
MPRPRSRCRDPHGAEALAAPPGRNAAKRCTASLKDEGATRQGLVDEVRRAGATECCCAPTARSDR